MARELTIDELLTTTRAIRQRLDLDNPVDLTVVEECVRIALQAPSGSNEQSWHWIVVTDPEVRARLGELYLEAFNERRARASAAAGRATPAPRTPEGPQAVPDVAAAGDTVPRHTVANDSRRRVMRSSTYLAENLARVPVHIVPCVRSYLPHHPADAELIRATLYASIFPAVWNLQLALRSRGYGSCLTTLHLMRHAQAADLLGIPAGYAQACLLPVARLTGENTFSPAVRQPLESVMSRDRF
jgi:nitroreductase